MAFVKTLAQHTPIKEPRFMRNKSCGSTRRRSKFCVKC
jgi:hypothetical protein